MSQIKIYDVKTDEMRAVTQKDVDELQAGINHLAWIKTVIHRLSAPGMYQFLTQERRTALLAILEDAERERHAKYPRATQTPVP